MQFKDIQPGTKFTIYPGMPERIFTKVEERPPTGWPDRVECATCGQKPVKMNAYEYATRGRVYHHICPNTTLPRVFFESEASDVPTT